MNWDFFKIKKGNWKAKIGAGVATIIGGLPQFIIFLKPIYYYPTEFIFGWGLGLIFLWYILYLIFKGIGLLYHKIFRKK